MLIFPKHSMWSGVFLIWIKHFVNNILVSSVNFKSHWMAKQSSESIRTTFGSNWYNPIQRPQNHVTEDDNGNSFELSYSENSKYNYSNKSMLSWWGIDSYFNIEQIQIRYIKLWSLHMVRRDCLDPEYGPNLLNIKPIQAEKLISVQNQHQLMD